MRREFLKKLSLVPAFGFLVAKANAEPAEVIAEDHGPEFNLKYYQEGKKHWVIWDDAEVTEQNILQIIHDFQIRFNTSVKSITMGFYALASFVSFLPMDRRFIVKDTPWVEAKEEIEKDLVLFAPAVYAKVKLSEEIPFNQVIFRT